MLIYLFWKYCAGFQQWRLISLAAGLLMLLLAPIVSSWVPFYYSSSMAIGIFLVIIIVLFQVYKLLSYSTWFSSLLPSFLTNFFWLWCRAWNYYQLEEKTSFTLPYMDQWWVWLSFGWCSFAALHVSCTYCHSPNIYYCVMF
jgi:hypothetical protein